MKDTLLADVLLKLKASPKVKGIFTTGSTAKRLTPDSDIDLVVILDKNKAGIKSVYTMIQNHFSDIFFFDIKFLNQLTDKRDFSANNFEGIFADWLGKGKINYDPDNLLASLKASLRSNRGSLIVDESEKRDFWLKINYNLIANIRYFNAQDDIYHKALEFRLLYSVTELINAYFSFRNIPWRGEKAAVAYFEKNDKGFFANFDNYLQSRHLTDRMKYYQMLFRMVVFGEYQQWKEDFVVPIPQNKGEDSAQLLLFWESLLSKK